MKKKSGKATIDIPTEEKRKKEKIYNIAKAVIGGLAVAKAAHSVYKLSKG